MRQEKRRLCSEVIGIMEKSLVSTCAASALEYIMRQTVEFVSCLWLRHVVCLALGTNRFLDFRVFKILRKFILTQGAIITKDEF